MPLYVIDTISTFRMKYVVEADSIEHAYDEVVMKESGCPDDEFSEVTQRYLGEHIVDGHEITKEQYAELLNTLKNDSYENCSHWMGEELIRKIDYKRD